MEAETLEEPVNFERKLEAMKSARHVRRDDQGSNDVGNLGESILADLQGRQPGPQGFFDRGEEQIPSSRFQLQGIKESQTTQQVWRGVASRYRIKE